MTNSQFILLRSRSKFALHSRLISFRPQVTTLLEGASVPRHVARPAFKHVVSKRERAPILAAKLVEPVCQFLCINLAAQAQDESVAGSNSVMYSHFTE